MTKPILKDDWRGLLGLSLVGLLVATGGFFAFKRVAGRVAAQSGLQLGVDVPARTRNASVQAPLHLRLASGLDSLNMGSAVEGQRVDREVVLINEGGYDVAVTRLVKSCGCTEVDLSRNELGPNVDAVLSLSVDTSGRGGTILTSVITILGRKAGDSADVVLGRIPLYLTVDKGPMCWASPLDVLVPLSDRGKDVEFECRISLEAPGLNLEGVAPDVVARHSGRPIDTQLLESVLSEGQVERSMVWFGDFSCRVAAGAVASKLVEPVVFTVSIGDCVGECRVNLIVDGDVSREGQLASVVFLGAAAEGAQVVHPLEGGELEAIYGSPRALDSVDPLWVSTHECLRLELLDEGFGTPRACVLLDTAGLSGEFRGSVRYGVEDAVLEVVAFVRPRIVKGVDYE